MNTPEFVRNLGRSIAPSYMADRARRYEQDYRERTGVTALGTSIAQNGRVVSSGPFVGMTLGEPLREVDAAPAKLIGSYEEELSDVFSGAIADGVTAFVDVGCADGYYAVGMAYASAATTTYAFDLAGSARRLCSATAAANGVAARVKMGGRCDASALRRLPLDDALVLVDIEGGELAFFEAEVIALLATSRVVVEVHEDDVPGAGDVLGARFASTHDARRVPQATRDPSRYPSLASLPPDQQRLAVAEHRGPLLDWLILTPR